MPLESTAGTQIAQLFSGRVLWVGTELLQWHLNTSTTTLLLPVPNNQLLTISSLTALSSSLTITEINNLGRLLACHLNMVGQTSTKTTNESHPFFRAWMLEDQRFEAFHTHSVACPVVMVTSWLSLPWQPFPAAPWHLFPKATTHRQYLPLATA